MCNTMELEKAVAGDVNASMMVQSDLTGNVGKDTVAPGHRASLKDFFMPVSQRSKKLGDEPNPAFQPSVDVARKKRGRLRKKSLEDDSRDFFVRLSAKEKLKKIGSPDAILNPAPVRVAEHGAVKGIKPQKKLSGDYGSDFFGPVSKRERSKKEFSRNDAATLEKISFGAEEGAKKRGRPRKSSLESDGIVVHIPPSEEVDDIFMPRRGRSSKRQKLQEELLNKKPEETGKVPSNPISRKDGQVEKHSAETVHAVPRQQTTLGEENKSVSVGHPAKETPSSIPCSAVGREELDLRLEAVLAAKENARLNAGRAPHPFFARKKVSSLKATIPWDEVSTCQVDDLQPGPPMHISQLLEDKRTEVVWTDWNFRSASGDEESKLEFSKMEPNRCQLIGLSVPSIWAEAVQWTDSQFCSTNDSELAGCPAVGGEERRSDGDETTCFLKALQGFLQHVQALKSTTEAAGEPAQSPEVCRKLVADLSLENLKNRLSLYSARHEVLGSAENATISQVSKEPDEKVVLSTRNELWTDLYQPRSSKEVCGNTTAVDGLNTWLYNWQLKITGQLVRGEDDSKAVKRESDPDYDSDKGWFEGESDYDSDIGDDNESGLHNTLLLTGPEGSGKSAAVYACAGEQGFTVIEVNASDSRNGALIKQKFGEAMESHGLVKGSQGGVESPEPASKKGLCSQDASRDENQMDSQSKRKTVILFEDVDKQFDTDKGFLTALVQLSKTSKRPIILTSNRYEPGLPPALEKFRFEFRPLTSEELVLHTCLVAIAEGAPCSPWVLERLGDACHHDLRKVMMALQFWGQGKLPLHRPSILCIQPGSVKIPNHRLILARKVCQGWESDIRFLFELDVHHLILPKIISGSSECPVTLFIEEKLSAAVRELEEHLDWVAASESEERARGQEAEYESMELTRKALKKEKDALRKASQSTPRVLDDSSNPSPDENELENRCGENWACSPVKNLREAKTLARSPLKPKILKSRRALLMRDSDDEEQRFSEQREESSEAGILSSNDIHVVSENLEDVDVTHSSSSEVVRTVRRRFGSKHKEPSSSPWGTRTGETASKCHLIGFEVAPTVLAEDLERPLLVADVEDRLTTDLNSLISGGCETSGSLGIAGIVSPQTFGSSGENPVFSSFISGDDPLEDISMDTRALDESNYVHASGRQSKHVLQSCSKELVKDSKDDLQESELVVPPVDLSRGPVGSLPTVHGSSKESVFDISLSTVSGNQKNVEGSAVPVFEPVYDAWASLRKSQQKPSPLLKHTETSADVASSFADLLDIISASDVISSVEPEEFKDAWRNFDGNFSEAFEGNMGHSSDRDNCQEIASQLVCTGLQLSLASLPAVNHVEDRLPVLSCILECAKDAPAVGKCMVSYFGVTRGSHQSSNMMDNLSAKMSLTRQADRRDRLNDVLQAAVFPRGRISGSGFVEYAAYLSRISKIEEIRRTNGIVLGRRPRRFEHYLTPKVKLSDSEITELLKYGTFKSS